MTEGPVVLVDRDGFVRRDDVLLGRIEAVTGTGLTLWKAYDANGDLLSTLQSRGEALAYVKWAAR